MNTPSRTYKKNYLTKLSLSISEKEFLALSYSCVKWREFIYGQKVIVYTDHSSLVYFKSFRNLSSRLTRLSLQLVDFDLDIRYKKGKEITLPDFLSRNENADDMEPEILGDTLNAILTVDLPTAQLQDEELPGQIITTIKNPTAATKKDKKIADGHTLQHNILYKTVDKLQRRRAYCYSYSYLPNSRNNLKFSRQHIRGSTLEFRKNVS